LLHCQQYIELNPVRANMVEHPADYRWSSYRCNALGEQCRLIKPHFMYEALGSTETARQESYRELFRVNLEPGVIDEIRQATNGNFVLGDNRFKDEVSGMLKRRVVPGKAGRPLKKRE